MATIERVPKDYPAEITGYAEPWLAYPNNVLDIKVGKNNHLQLTSRWTG